MNSIYTFEKSRNTPEWYASTELKHGNDSDSYRRCDSEIESRNVFAQIDRYAERIHLHQQNPATATLAAFSSAMGRYSASRHPPPRYPHPASRASSVFCPYRRCFRSTPSILPLTYPSSPTIVPFSHPLYFLPLRRPPLPLPPPSPPTVSTFPPLPPPPLLLSVASSIGVPVD